MNKKRIALFCSAALVAAGIGLNIQNALANYGIGENSLSLVAGPGSGSNSNGSSNSNSNSHEPAWWDFFNNYFVEERIPINTTTCHNGSVSYNGVTFSLSSCTQYTYAVYRHCYDGGNESLCTSSHVHTYI